MLKTWWKQGVIYQIYPRSFRDSNGDGIGDLPGIIASLDYLQSLNVDILWLSPIFPSPNVDNGYDVSDYRNIHPEFGTMEDFDSLLLGVHERGMKLILDIVANHCSDEHEWFRQSRSSKDSAYRDYFFWKPGKLADTAGESITNHKLPITSHQSSITNHQSPITNWQSFFGGSAWEFDEATGEFYLHLFHKKQPDLNWENPAVRREMHEIMRFWFDKGVDGVRLDVITLISKRLDFAAADFSKFRTAIETTYANGPRLHEFLHEMNREVFSRFNVMALGEGIGITPENVLEFTAEANRELHLIYHFDLLNLTFGEDRYGEGLPVSLQDLKAIFQKWNDATTHDGWIAQAMGNHDYPRMVSRFGDEKRYWKESAKLLLVLLATQRGTLNIFQGDEIGMTNVAFSCIEDYNDVEVLNFYRQACEGKTEEERRGIFSQVQKACRDNARTPFQWDVSENAGFTTGKPWLGINANYKTISVEAQEADPFSILHFYRRVLAYRRENPIFVYGDYECLAPEHPQLFVYVRTFEGVRKLVLLNFSNTGAAFSMPDEFIKTRWELNNCDTFDMMGGRIWLKPWQAIVLGKVINGSQQKVEKDEAKITFEPIAGGGGSNLPGHISTK